MRAAAAVFVAALVAAECERAPAEDFGRHSQVAALPASARSGDVAEAWRPSPPANGRVGGDGSAAAKGGRCVQPTPRDPPPAVPAGPAAGCPPDPEGASAKPPVVRVSFPNASDITVDAELVRSEHDTMRGLMYRKSLGAMRGMLFDLTFRDDHKFWMHNTCIPLDILYIDEDGLLVGIVESAPTLDDSSRGVSCPSRWVLEVNAGWSRLHGVKAGQHVTLP